MGKEVGLGIVLGLLKEWKRSIGEVLSGVLLTGMVFGPSGRLHLILPRDLPAGVVCT